MNAHRLNVASVRRSTHLANAFRVCLCSCDMMDLRWQRSQANPASSSRRVNVRVLSFLAALIFFFTNANVTLARLRFLNTNALIFLSKAFVVTRGFPRKVAVAR